MKSIGKLVIYLIVMLSGMSAHSQSVIEQYAELNNDSLRSGPGPDDFMPYIQSGYTLMLPEGKSIDGVLILLEDAGLDKKNFNAKQLYAAADKKQFAVLSVSTEIPLDFYFSEASITFAHNLIQEAFSKYDLPNKNVFFLGASLVGHRAMRYIQYVHENELDFEPHIHGIILCDFTLDWTRKWQQHTRDIRIDKIDLWEARFINYMLETHLEGTPETVPESYHNFSAYSHADPSNRNIPIYSEMAIRAYIEPAINYRLKKYHRTLYENNATDIVGFLAELELAGNEETELIVFESEAEANEPRNTQSTWNTIDKVELMEWIVAHSNK